MPRNDCYRSEVLKIEPKAKSKRVTYGPIAGFRFVIFVGREEVASSYESRKVAWRLVWERLKNAT